MFFYFPSTLLKCFWARHWIQLQVCSLVTDHAPYSVCHSFIHYFQGQLISQLQDLSVLSDHGKIEQCMFKKKRLLPIFLYLCIRHPWRTHVTSCFGLSENQDCPATISWFTFTLSQYLDSEITMEPIKKGMQRLWWGLRFAKRKHDANKRWRKIVSNYNMTTRQM